MHKEEVELLVIALSSPIYIGVYKEQKLIKTIKSDEKSSEVLPLLFEEIMKEYDVKSLFFANGPGSFMAIKVTYVFLKSLSILKNIPLYATDAFKFNKNQPIKAIGKLFFVKIGEDIETQKLEDVAPSGFELPQQLNYDEFSTNTTPLYKIGAVG